MPLRAAVGQAQSIEGREAGAQAAGQALSRLGRAPLSVGLVVVSHIYPIQQVLAGVAGLLGDTPLLGFSTSGELSPAGASKRSVVVALLAGEGVQVRADWWPGFSEDTAACVQKMLHALPPSGDEKEILLAVADGISGDAAHLCSAVCGDHFSLVGCLAGGDLLRGRTFQIGGRQSGHGGLAAAALSGRLVVGIGAAHGWQPVGALSRLTKVQGMWVRTLDDRPPSETYARLFGYSPREWAFPPLNELVRIYPLGLQQAGELVVRSPLRVEADGSLRMNVSLPENQTAYLLVGSRSGAHQAALQAARQALAGLGGARPVLAWVLVDAAWQTLLDLEPGAELAAVRSVLGEELPLIGGYTLGQLACDQPDSPAHLLNQHIVVVVLAEPAE